MAASSEDPCCSEAVAQSHQEPTKSDPSLCERSRLYSTPETRQTYPSNCRSTMHHSQPTLPWSQASQCQTFACNYWASSENNEFGFVRNGQQPVCGAVIGTDPQNGWDDTDRDESVNHSVKNITSSEEAVASGATANTCMNDVTGRDVVGKMVSSPQNLSGSRQLNSCNSDGNDVFPVRQHLCTSLPNQLISRREACSCSKGRGAHVCVNGVVDEETVETVHHPESSVFMEGDQNSHSSETLGLMEQQQQQVKHHLNQQQPLGSTSSSLPQGTRLRQAVVGSTSSSLPQGTGLTQAVSEVEKDVTPEFASHQEPPGNVQPSLKHVASIKEATVFANGDRVSETTNFGQNLPHRSKVDNATEGTRLSKFNEYLNMSPTYNPGLQNKNVSPTYSTDTSCIIGSNIPSLNTTTRNVAQNISNERRQQISFGASENRETYPVKETRASSRVCAIGTAHGNSSDIEDNLVSGGSSSFKKWSFSKQNSQESSYDGHRDLQAVGGYDDMKKSSVQGTTNGNDVNHNFMPFGLSVAEHHGCQCQSGQCIISEEQFFDGSRRQLTNIASSVSNSKMNIPDSNFSLPSCNTCKIQKGIEKDQMEVAELPLDMLQELEQYLDPERPLIKDWRHLASIHKVKNKQIKYIQSVRHIPSPTSHLWQLPEFHGYTVMELKEDLRRIQRLDCLSKLENYMESQFV